MPKPLIGITTAEIKNYHHPWMPATHGQLPHYADAVIRGGGIPVLLPIVEEVEIMRELYDRCDGILFAGGEDVDPAYYHEIRHPKLGRVSPGRDTQEFELIAWALEDHKPILAICRGMQLLNVALGGSLHQDISSDFSDKENHESSTDSQNLSHVAHRLFVEAGSQLADILEASVIKANSRHHQAVKTLGRNLRDVAWAKDGIIEAIESIELPFAIGVQSHPEAIEAEIETLWQKLFTAFVGAAQPLTAGVPAAHSPRPERAAS